MATLGIRASLSSEPTISIEKAAGEAVAVVSMDASSVVEGPLIATRLDLDFVQLEVSAVLRVALPPRAAVLESDVSPRFCGDIAPPPTVAPGMWTKRLGFGLRHFSLIYAQPLEHGQAVVVNLAGNPKPSHLNASLADQDGRPLAKPLVLSEAEITGEVVVRLEVEGEAFRAGDLAMVKVTPVGEQGSAPVSDTIVAIDTSASSANEWVHRVEQTRMLAHMVRGNLALIAFDQAQHRRLGPLRLPFPVTSAGYWRALRMEFR